jgi:hypothetical protein
MAQDEFTEYSIKETKDAFKARKGLSAELQNEADRLMWDLAAAPDRYPERTSSLGRAGGVRLYRHPNPKLEITFEVDHEKKVVYFFHFVSPALPSRPTVFISYSHKDRKWIELLKKFLTVLEQEGVLTIWDDSTNIKAGELWEDSIKEALDSARAAVLLVSQDFLDSDFIRKYELPRILAAAQRDGTRVFWIPVRESTVWDTHKEITAFQSPLPNPHKPLSEMRATDRERVLVQFSKRVAEALVAG